MLDARPADTQTGITKGAPPMSHVVTFIRAASPKPAKKDLPSRKPIKGGRVPSKHAE